MKLRKWTVIIFAVTASLLAVVGRPAEKRPYDFREKNGSYEIFIAGNPVGRVDRIEYEVDTAMKEKFTDNVFYTSWLVRENGILKVEPENSDWCTGGSSLYSDLQLGYGIDGTNYYHEYFVFDNYLYDLWFYDDLVTEEQETELIEYFMDHVMPEEYPPYIEG